MKQWKTLIHMLINPGKSNMNDKSRDLYLVNVIKTRLHGMFHETPPTITFPNVLARKVARGGKKRSLITWNDQGLAGSAMKVRSRIGVG